MLRFFLLAVCFLMLAAPVASADITIITHTPPAPQPPAPAVPAEPVARRPLDPRPYNARPVRPTTYAPAPNPEKKPELIPEDDETTKTKAPVNDKSKAAEPTPDEEEEPSPFGKIGGLGKVGANTPEK